MLFTTADELCGLDRHTRFKIIKGNCEGLKYIHEELEAPIYHLDLKPDNILLDKDMIPKIADFGLSRIFNKEPKRTTPNPYGTHGYQPPEYIDRGEISGKFDIFSLGIIMIRIVSGSKGYPKCLDMPSDEFIDQVQNNWRKRLQSTCSSDSSLEAYCHQIATCTQIALKCVEKDSQKRPNIVTILEKLNEIETRIGKIKRTDESKDIRCQHQNINLMTSRSELDITDVQAKSTEVIELIVGRTEEKRKIMDLLLNVMSEKIVILPIYGIGGIGKTTFARLIYNDTKFKHYSQVWVDVTQRFDLNKIHDSIISQLSKKESQTNERHIIRSCTTKVLSGKKILVVLDDLWEDDQLQLKELKDMIYNDYSNIIVLVTTRSERVAKIICTNLEPYKILPLTNDMCWDIIKQRSGFEDRDDKEQLMGIGLEIAQKCGGMALAARSLGFTLRSMNFDQWMEVKNSGIWNEPNSKEVSLPNHALASLKLSYSYMNPWLKPCFTYCAIFPKGHKIVKNDLDYQWISLDFIKPTKLLSNMQLSEKYIVQLLGLSFFQHSVSPENVEVYHKGVEVFTMHDLVHDLARLVIGDEILDTTKQGNNTRGGRYSFALLDDCSKPLESFTQYPSKIRALRFLNSDKILLHGASSSFSKFLCFWNFGKIGIHDNVFSSAKYLRVLDLSECSTQKLPRSIGNLKQLRYFNASRVHQAIPDCITKLSNLIYLSLCGSSEIVAVSESVGQMEGLMYLDLSDCSGLEKLPLSFGRLKELVHLDLSKCSKVTNISESLERLTNLEHLNLSYCSNIGDLPKHLGSLLKLRNLDLSSSSYIDGRANVATLVTLTKLECLNLASHLSFMENLPEALRRLTNLRLENVKSAQEAQSINLKEKSRMENMELNWTKDVGRFVEDMEVLGELVPPTNLEVLKIDGYSSVRFPKWFVDIAFHLPNLVSISMSGFSKCNSLPPLGQLPNLEYLNLERMNGISEINWDLCGSRGTFPRLRFFTLRQMKSLKVWYTTYFGDKGVSEFMFPRLSNLEISDCPHLRMKPCPHGAWYFCRIQGRSDGVMSSWEPWTSVSPPSSARITNLHIDGCKIPMHQWRLLQHLPGLTTLSISECSDLSSSPNIIRALSSLQKLQVEELPNWLGQLASLEDLTVRCRHEVKPWHDGFPHLTRLRSLCLFEFQSMTTVQQWVGSLVSLQRLEILDCENLNDLAESFGHLSSLNELRISVCNRIKSLPDSIGRLTSLRRLRIDYCDGITSLPESIGALTSLDKLKIMNCDDITSLPESICGLLSLNKLIILHCPSITSLPESILYYNS
ncbi:unnamed protein product [Urochloa decumbens]|uniref:Protein kinase domain-containing protein n=1 Tax=Urochloa decumbens TaxID=240449 RepID=A0ABC9DYK4_9POAL